MGDVITPRANGGGVAVSEGVVTNDPRTGRFSGGGKLTSQQEAFVLEYIANGGNGTKAAEKAGYSCAPQAACYLMQNSGVIAAVRAAREKYIAGPLASKALRCLEQIMDDPGASPGARVQAAKYSLDAAGHGLAAQLGAARLGLDTEDKALADMNVHELEAFLAKAKPVLEGMQAVSRAVTAPVIELKP